MHYMLIKDSYYKHDWGMLEYNERTKQFRLYVRRDKQYKVYPILLQSLVYRHHTFVMEPELALIWVQERLVPPSRKNIDEILDSVGIPEYDEYELLKAYNGKCPQDDVYLQLLSNDEALYYIKKYNIELVQ